MRYWGIGLFEDIISCDVYSEFYDSEDLEATIKFYLQKALNGKKLVYDDGFCVVMSAAIIDSILNGTNYDLEDSDYIKWITLLKQKNFKVEHLKSDAANALDIVLSKKSQLNRVWKKRNGYEEWKDNIMLIKNRINNK